jgi:hypothetical protein
LIYYWIDLKKLWLACFNKVVGFTVEVVVHPPNLGLTKKVLDIEPLKSLVDKRRFWQRGPASQHDRR